MKRRFLSIALFCLALLAALWAYVQSDSFAARIRPLVAGPLQEALGPGARIGRVKANLLPLYLEVRDIVVPVEGNSEAVAVRRVRVYLNPFPLLYRTVSIPSLSLLEPRLAAARSAAGEIDLVRLVDRVRASLERGKRQAAPSYRIKIRMITIRNGRVVFTDAATKTIAALSRMNMRMKLSLPAASLHLRLASGDLSVSAPAYREIRGKARGTIAYDQGRLSLEGCELASEDSRIALSGSAQMASGGPLDLTITSTIGRRSLGRIAALLAREKRAKGPFLESRAKITGTVQEPIVAGTVRMAGIAFGGIGISDAAARFAFKKGRVSFAAEQWKLAKGPRQADIREIVLEADYRRGVLEVTRASIQADDLQLHAMGTIDTEQGYRITVSAQSSGEGRTASLVAGNAISGNASASGLLSGRLASPRFEGRLEAGPLSVRSVPFTSLAGDLAFQDRVLALEDAEIRHGQSRYLFNGSVNFTGSEPAYTATLDVKQSDVVSIVALFYKRIPLELSATGHLAFRGTRKDFSGEGRLDVGPGSAYGESFDRGSVTVTLTRDRISFPRVIAEKKKGTVTGDGWIGFDGTYAAHVTSAGVDLAEVDHVRKLPFAGPFVLDIRSSGSFSSPAVTAHGSTERLLYREAALGPASADLEIRNGVLSFAASTRDGLLAANGTWHLKPPYLWDVSTSLRINDYDPSALAEENELLAKVKVTAEGSVTARGSGLDLASVSGAAHFRKIGLTFGELRLENEGEAHIRLDAGRAAVQSLILKGPGTRLAVTGDTMLGRDVDFSFDGLASLSLLRVLYREVEHGDGTASVRLSVVGDWSNPDVAGELTIRDGQIKIRDIPQKFTALNGSIGFSQNRVVTDGLSGEVGGGSVAVTGNAQLDGSRLVDFSARAAIENVTVRYPAGLVATVGGALYYDGDADSQTLSGEVQVRRAKYEKRVEWKSMLVDFSRGFTQKKKTDIGWIGETQLNVRFLGRENILFESNLAKIPLDIDMLFRGTVNQPQVLGRIEALKGEVYFRKNVFKILHASADFTDPNRINPTLDVQAETRVREYQIQLGVTGTADRAVVTFVSEPPLSDSNILALLALGRTSDELKGMESNVGVGEATSFATGKFQDILESRARSLTGLDRFQVDPYISKTDVAVPRVTVGKEVVQDRLFMTYSSNVGASTPEQVFRIEYILNRNMSLVGEQNELGNLGADVKFRFEFK
ncbi:MAG: translocation/assembly module TamB domain-containing protein [Nitrospirota bacterium]